MTSGATARVGEPRLDRCRQPVQMAPDFAADRPVTFASDFFEVEPAHDRDVSSPMGDRAEPLEFAQSDRHGRPLDSEPECQKLVG